MGIPRYGIPVIMLSFTFGGFKDDHKIGLDMEISYNKLESHYLSGQQQGFSSAAPIRILLAESIDHRCLPFE